MARTESKSIVCSPQDEQTQIDLMSSFYWRLLSTQEVRQLDSHLELRGENLYSVTKDVRYIKLAFQRETDIPHYEMIKGLEKDYNALPIPKFPKVFPVSGCFFSAMFVCLFPLTVPAWLIYLIFVYPLNRRKAQREYEQLVISRQEIMERLDHIEKLPVSA